MGREHELAQIGEILGKTRLLTLVGPGGVGKSRLAAQTGARFGRAYPDGALWVDLAGLGAPDLMPETVAGALGLHEEVARPVLATIVKHLQACTSYWLLAKTI